MRNVVEEKLRLFKGFVGTAVTVSCRSCVFMCGGVGDNDRVRVFSQLLSSSFSLPLVDYVGGITISCVNGGSVGP